jgi:hypothetical protein
VVDDELVEDDVAGAGGTVGVLVLEFRRKPVRLN